MDSFYIFISSYSQIYFILLQLVVIHDNSVEYIDPRAFEGLAQLEKLQLNCRKLKKTLKFTSIGSLLVELSLKNVVEDFENLDLMPFIVLKFLQMIRGRITIIPKNIHYVAGTLRTLSLAHNRIGTLDGMNNITFEKLRYLYLMNNKISNVNALLLQLPVLEQIHLDRNQLKQLEDFRFCTWGMGNDRSPSFAFGDNPWHCNDSMKALIKTLCRKQNLAYFRREPLGISLKLLDMVCESPVDVKGEAFASVFEVVIQEMDNCPGGELLEAMSIIDLMRIYLSLWQVLPLRNTNISIYHRPFRLFTIVVGTTLVLHK